MVNKLLVILAAVMAGSSLLPQAFAGGGGGRSGITEECSKATCEVEMVGLMFAPGVLIVKPGAKVVWTNMDKLPHTVTSGKPSEGNSGTLFDSGVEPLITAGEKWEHRFTAAGMYDYFCQVHPRMMGQVVVSGEPMHEFPQLATMLGLAGASASAIGMVWFRKKHTA